MTCRTDFIPDRPIVLVGLMGVGKTFLGKRLARRLDLPFIDSDEEIETAAGMTISEIFAAHGEPYFRAGERRVIARLVSGEPLVLSTGGGAFVDDQTRALLLDRAAVIWLDAPVETLVERVGRRNNRPLLNGPEDPADVLSRLIEVRRPAYSQAQIRVDVDPQPGVDAVEQMIDALRAFAPPA